MRWSDSVFRSCFRRLSATTKSDMCRWLLHLQRLPFAAFWKRFFWFSLQRDPEVAMCCNYDWYGPAYHHEHSAVEVMNWFADSGFQEIQ